MPLPYQNTSVGVKAMADLQKILLGFKCQGFGYGEDFVAKTLTVQFKHHDHHVQVTASAAGYAALWLRENPWSSRTRCSKEKHTERAYLIARTAIFSILRDWVKGQVVAVETGILSFEAAFLGQIVLENGETVLDRITHTKVLELGHHGKSD